MHTEEKTQHNNAFCLVYLYIQYLWRLSFLQFCQINNHYWANQAFIFKLSLMDITQTTLHKFLYHWLVHYIPVSDFHFAMWMKS